VTTAVSGGSIRSGWPLRTSAASACQAQAGEAAAAGPARQECWEAAAAAAAAGCEAGGRGGRRCLPCMRQGRGGGARKKVCQPTCERHQLGAIDGASSTQARLQPLPAAGNAHL
jgi:hypothetical protein